MGMFTEGPNHDVYYMLKSFIKENDLKSELGLATFMLDNQAKTLDFLYSICKVVFDDKKNKGY